MNKNLLTIQSCEPNFEVEQNMGIEEFEEKAREAFEFCNSCDLQVQIWRGRIISALRALHQGRDCSRRTDKWIQEMGCTLKQASTWEQVAQEADNLIANNQLTEKGIANIEGKAFVRVIKEAPQIAPMVAQEAEQGAKIDVDRAKHLIGEQIVNEADVSPNLKQSVSKGLVKATKAATLIRNLAEIDVEEAYSFEEAQDLKRDLDKEDIGHDEVEEALEVSKALRNYELNVGSHLLADFDPKKLLAEGLKAEVVSLLATITTQAQKIENLGAKLISTLAAFEKNQDLLYVSTGTNHPQLRELSSLLKISSLNQQKIILNLSSTVKAEITVQIFEEKEESLDDQK